MLNSEILDNLLHCSNVCQNVFNNGHRTIAQTMAYTTDFNHAQSNCLRVRPCYALFVGQPHSKIKLAISQLVAKAITCVTSSLLIDCETSELTFTVTYCTVQYKLKVKLKVLQYAALSSSRTSHQVQTCTHLQVTPSTRFN